jgi:hypothetical protein
MVAGMEPGAQLIIEVQGEDFNGKEYTKTLMLPVGDEKSGTERLDAIGLEIRDEEGKILVDNVVFASPAEKAGIDFDQEVLNVRLPNQRPPKQLMFIPALLLAGVVWFVQRGRRRKLAAA